MDFTLGRFGDRRLEKGGPFCWVVWLRVADAGFGFGGWVETVPERCA